jgi:hypothetical protein
MEKSKTVKVLTLAGFVMLLGGFIAFKAGTFESASTHKTVLPLQEFDNSNSPEMMLDSPPAKKPDTPKVKANPHMMSTSKSAVFIDQKVQFNKRDTVKKENKTAAPKK